MALRAFQNNPSIGGFGNESRGLVIIPTHRKDEGGDHGPVLTTSSTTASTTSTGNHDHKHQHQSTDKKKDHYGRRNQAFKEKSNLSPPSEKYSGDAFAQILKELVENAIDACRIISTTKTDSIITTSSDTVEKGLKRVRVSIEKVDSNISGNDSNIGCCSELLRVTVSDNGCGMMDIEKCVSVFSTSKTSHTASTSDDDTRHSSNQSFEKQNDNEIYNHCEAGNPTAGRYGIGLTLSLLHAQRLVPDSCTSITSSTLDQQTWTVAKFVVDAAKDTIVCVEKKSHGKKNGVNESGTAVSLLLPGGIEAQKAWPRLAEYFARFQFSLDLRCSLQIMAPSLSNKPLYIRPISEEINDGREKPMRSGNKSIENEATKCADETNDNKSCKNNHELDIDDWFDVMICDYEPHNGHLLSPQNQKEAHEEQLFGIDDCIDNFQCDRKSVKVPSNIHLKTNKKIRNGFHFQDQCKKSNDNDDRRKLVQSAVSAYLKKHVPLENIVSSSQKINIGANKRNKMHKKSPFLLVDLIVCNNEDEDIDSHSHASDDCNSVVDIDNKKEENDYGNDTSAKICVIRMVNQIPLLDGAEASACGIVKGVSRIQSVWNSFGLDVSPLCELGLSYSRSTDTTSYVRQQHAYSLHMPTYSLKDSANVASYLEQNRTHDLFEDEDTETEETESKVEDDELSCESFDERKRDRTRQRKKKRMLLLPVGLRLRKVLIIVRIDANPVDLPLPTLSKGRLPMNDKAIDDALELGITSCLQKLQVMRPSLLLNASQLRKTERDVKFIPAASSALVSLVENCDDIRLKMEMENMIREWQPLDISDKVSVVTPEYVRGNSQLTDAESGLSSHKESATKMHCNIIVPPTLPPSEQVVYTVVKRFHSTVRSVEKTKIEKAKRAKAENTRKRKKVIKSSPDSDGLSTTSSLDDLDRFIQREGHKHEDIDGSRVSSACSRNSNPEDFNENLESSRKDNESTKDEERPNNYSNDFDDDSWW